MKYGSSLFLAVLGLAALTGSEALKTQSESQSVLLSLAAARPNDSSWKHPTEVSVRGFAAGTCALNAYYPEVGGSRQQVAVSFEKEFATGSPPRDVTAFMEALSFTDGCVPLRLVSVFVGATRHGWGRDTVRLYGKCGSSDTD